MTAAQRAKLASSLRPFYVWLSGNFLANKANLGSPCRIKDRTFSCSFELPRRGVKPDPPKLYPNPLVLAQAWQNQLDNGEVKSRADLARQLGVSRAHVTQVLRLLRLAPHAKEAVLALGDPIEGRVVGAHTLRSMASLSVKEQESKILSCISRKA